MSDKRKILLLTDWYEPGFKAGGPIQSCKNFVTALHEDYDLHVLTSDRDQGDTRPYRGMITNTWISRKPGIRIYYASLHHLDKTRLRQLIRDASPDYIYLNSMYSYRFTILPLWLKWQGKISAGIVVAPRGMLHQGAMQFKSWKKKLFIKLFNAVGLPGKLTFQATDEQEKKDIFHYFPGAGKVRVVPNFTKMAPVEWKPIQKIPGKLSCVFISRMAPKKNLLFLLEVLSELPAGLSVTLDLYGEIEDTQYWERCLSVIRSLPAFVRVAWKGAIPNEVVTEVLQQHHIFVLPTLGENFGHAIFEALLAGKPVLISDKTPWLGLGSEQAGYDLPLEKGLFRQALEKLATMDQETYDKWSLSTFSYAAKVQSSINLKDSYRELFS